MATVEDFKLRITVEGDGKIRAVSAAIGDLKKDVDGFSQVSGPLGNTINGIVGRLGTMATVGLAAGAVFVGLGMKAMQLADQLQDISDASGVSAGALLNFKASLIEAGGKADDFTSFATKLAQTLGDAATGGEAAQKSFQKLGVFVRDANGNIRDSGDVLRDVIGKLGAIEDPAKRSALAVELLGKQAKMIDWSKVSAINDPFKDEQIKQLAKYQEAIDKISNSVTNSLITVFGKLAVAIDNAQAKADAAQKAAEERGNTMYPSPVTGQPLERPMTKKEQSEYELRKKIAEAYKDQAREMSRLQKIGQEGGGDFGAESEVNAKARIENAKRVAQSMAEVERFELLKGANEIQAIQINAQAEIAKAKLEINSRERLTDQQKIAEIASKTAEIEQKALVDTAKVRSQQNAKIYSELESQRQKSNEELAAEEIRIANIVESARQLSVEQNNQLEAQKRKNDLLANVAGLSDREARNVQELFDLEEQRLTVLRQIANIKDLPYDERLKRETEINEQIRQRKQLAIDNQAIDKRNAENFAAGWSKAYANFNDNTRNAAATATRLFQKFTGGLEDYFINRLKGMDGGWKKFTQGILEEIARANLSKVIANIFNPDTGVLGGIGKIFGALTGAGAGASPGASPGISANNPMYAYITNLSGGLGMPGITPPAGTGPSSGGAFDSIWTSVKDTASSVFDTVSGVFGSITDTIGGLFGGGGGGLFSGISDLFGGFFANGGMLGAGKFGIAGENGPELISGPATITPMGGSTNVTYNINAVDAMSFKAMIAADPSFIYAVTQQGAGSIPGRR